MVRIMHEARESPDNLFLTLTYDKWRLPENGSLVPEDLTRFFRRLKHYSGKYTYYGCGEYGEKGERPHYHAIVFGVQFQDMYSHPDTGRGNVWGSRDLEDIWGRGRTEIGTVTAASAAYVAGYVQKKMKPKQHGRINPLTGELLQQEFARMSLRPAIGKRWIERWWRDVYPRGYVVVDGYKASPPRYYDKWMDFEDHKGGSQERRDIMEDVRVQRYLDLEVPTSYELEAGEKIKQSRINLFQRRLGP